MIGPDLARGGEPTTSRRVFLRLAGGLVGLLVVPDLAAAAVRKAAAPAAKKAGGTASRPSPDRGRAAGGARAKASPAAKPRTASVRRAPTHGAGRVERAAAPRVEAIEPRIAYERAPAVISPQGLGPGCRAVGLYNTHTGESVNVDYFFDGRYDPDALREVDRVLRDYHTDEICPIDPEVLNQLHVVRATLETRDAFNVYSGYRSPETNDMYRRMSSRVAEHSYHVKGKAIDLSLPGRELRQVRAVALALASGGVGYYPSSGFVHVDSGPVRRW